jgi:hypothetical protein
MNQRVRSALGPPRTLARIQAVAAPRYHATKEATAPSYRFANAAECRSPGSPRTSETTSAASSTCSSRRFQAWLVASNSNLAPRSWRRQAEALPGRQGVPRAGTRPGHQRQLPRLFFTEAGLAGLHAMIGNCETGIVRPYSPPRAASTRAGQTIRPLSLVRLRATLGTPAETPACSATRRMAGRSS